MARFNPAKYDARNDSTPGTDDLRPIVGAPEDSDDSRGYEGVILDLNAVVDGKLTPACECGCGSTMDDNGSRFKQGHDARLRGILIRAHVTGTEINRLQGGMASTSDAMNVAVNLDAGRENAYWVPALERAASAAKAKADRKAARAERKAADKAEDTFELGEVKVGRWVYPARKQGNKVERNSKRDGTGEWVAADAEFVPAA